MCDCKMCPNFDGTFMCVITIHLFAPVNSSLNVFKLLYYLYQSSWYLPKHDYADVLGEPSLMTLL